MTVRSSGTSWPLIGHSTSIERLRQMAARSRVPATSLFSGPPRVGRLAAALEFARALVCTNEVDGVACGNCSSCRRISSGNHPDVDVWSVDRQTKSSGASKSGALTIETVREIAVSAALRPYESSRRVVIVDEAETLGEDAQQALLKTLEDAPNFVSIILITSSVDAMIDTVRSRVVEVPFQLVPTPEIAAGLATLRPGADVEAIAQLAQGRAGWAVAAAENPTLIDHEREANQAIEQWIASSPRDRLITAYRTGESFAQQRSDVMRTIDSAMLAWRDLLLSASGNGQLAFDPQRSRRLDPSSRLAARDAYNALAACRQCQFDLSRNVRPKLALELMVNQWPTLS